jgi:predicted O-methyltransferase YrrM
MAKPEGTPGGWCPAKGLPNLVKDIKNPVGIEIGVCIGMTTTHLLDTILDLTLYGVDPYEEYAQMGGREAAYLEILENTKEYGDRFKLYRKTSDDASELFENETIDFIFIDGLHTYEQVKKDIENYYPKLKIGGLCSGHDYNGWKQTKVDIAVDECAASFGKKVEFCEQDMWYWYK